LSGIFTYFVKQLNKITMKFPKTLFMLLSTSFCFSQNSIPKVLDKLNNKTVPYITVSELKQKQNYVLMDARESKEYGVSHLQNAINVGYDKFDSKSISSLVKDKNELIVVYCSIGVRSERIGEKLIKLGFTNVFNLYGGIFEWKNNDGKTYNSKNIETDSIHTFNKRWSAYLKKGVKIY
jgi:rhodanese-related sulfurtransferase